MSPPSFLTGNQAIAEGAIAAGCRFYAGYPITPSSEIAEVLSGRLPEVGGVFVQMEDEIASIGAVVGASLGGLKAATATSGPGFSLMQENIGFAVATEIPCVIVDVQRVGPSTGLPTKVAQGDIMQARWGTHGDHPIIAIYPSSVQECFDLTVRAFDLAERFRTPVMLLSDAVVAGLREQVEVRTISRPAVRSGPGVEPAVYRPFDYSGDRPPPLAPFGTGYRYHVTGLIHDERGAPTEDPALVARWWQYMRRKLDAHLDEILDWEERSLEDADTVVVAYGCTARAAAHAVDLARDEGVPAGLLTLRTIWPFPDAVIDRLADRASRFVVAELNLGQVRAEVERVVRGRAEVAGLHRTDGLQLSPVQIVAELSSKRPVA
ncbi:MAG TPA: 2-oxoacid:acceptor oxidoreductase subunit alpha [Acidimicrobiales bacterium]|jgi:2-oxoglutarate ferredoxin oxidoreductase subunit alpha|nr:2-oxoacid:acceptor oxidoreductase subunit alpha [Acidimicrobiales bacterium]